MTGAAKRKGDRAENELKDLLADLTGLNIARAFGAGRADDIGDLLGFPDVAIQCTSLANRDLVHVGLVRKPIEAGQQAQNGRVPFAVTFVRIRGGTWRAVMTPDQFVAMWREATTDPGAIAALEENR